MESFIFNIIFSVNALVVLLFAFIILLMILEGDFITITTFIGDFITITTFIEVLLLLSYICCIVLALGATPILDIVIRDNAHINNDIDWKSLDSDQFKKYAKDHYTELAADNAKVAVAKAVLLKRNRDRIIVNVNDSLIPELESIKKIEADSPARRQQLVQLASTLGIILDMAQIKNNSTKLMGTVNSLLSRLAIAEKRISVIKQSIDSLSAKNAELRKKRKALKLINADGAEISGIDSNIVQNQNTLKNYRMELQNVNPEYAQLRNLAKLYQQITNLIDIESQHASRLMRIKQIQEAIAQKDNKATQYASSVQLLENVFSFSSTDKEREYAFWYLLLFWYAVLANDVVLVMLFWNDVKNPALRLSLFFVSIINTAITGLFVLLWKVF